MEIELKKTSVDKDNDKSNNIIFNIKDTKFYVPIVTLSAKEIKNYQNF